MLDAWILAWGLLRHPQTAWQALAQANSASPWRFTLVLATVAVLAASLGFASIGLYDGDFSLKFLPMVALQRASITALALVVIALLLAEAAHHWAPRFNASGKRAQTRQVALYALGPIWLWGQTLLWPIFWWAWPVALSLSLWQFHIGLRQIALPAPQREKIYTLTTLTSVGLLGLLLMLSRCDDVHTQSPLPAFPWEPLNAEQTAAFTPGKKPSGKASAANDAGVAGKSVAAGVPRIDGGSNGKLELPEGVAASNSNDLERWARSGQPTEPITRSVLQDFLPGAINGFDRRITESYAHTPDGNDAMRQVLTTGALARVENVSQQDKSHYLNLTIEDLQGTGEAIATTLLDELANTGGRSSLDDGRTQRQISADDEYITVQECFTPFRQCKLEVLVAKRYQLRAESAKMDPEELRHYVARVDIAALAARAKSNRPIE